MRALCVVLVCLVACGDGDEPPPAEECHPEPGELPTEGSFLDPYAIVLPDTCIDGGLRNLPGRWWVRAPNTYFQFEYPKYEGSCTNGWRRTGAQPEDHDATDKYHETFYTWTDGTRFYQRTRFVFDFDQGSYESTRVTVGCMLPDDTLAVTYGTFSSGSEERFVSATGTRFNPKDDVSAGIDFVSELGPKTGMPIYGLNLIVEGAYAYVVGTTGLDVVDVSNPAVPVAVGHVDGYLNDVRIVHGSGKTVAIASSEGGDDRTWLIDVTDPANPMFSNVIDEYSHSVQVRTVGSTTELYLANYSELVPRFDVTNPLAPIAMGAAKLPGETIDGVHDLTVYGDHLYVNNTEAGFVAVDTSNDFFNPTEVGRVHSAYSHASWAGQINGREIILHGDEGMNLTEDAAAYMRVLDGDPASPTYFQEIGRYASRPEVGIHNIEVHGTKAYISYYHDGARVVELADPAHPVEVAHYNTWDPETAYGDAFEGAVGLRKVGNYLYVADLERGLIILEEK